MSVTTTGPSAPVVGRSAGAAPAGPGFRGRRAPRHVLVGLALMVGCGLLFALLALRDEPGVEVLAVREPVAAGQVITETDLQVVRVVPDAGVELVAAEQRGEVVGRTAAVPLAAGGLLSPGQVGPPAWPAAGESVIAVPVVRAPVELTAGSRVTALVTQPEGAAEPVAVTATVVAVAAPDTSGVQVVSLLLPATQARTLAAAGGEVVLVLEHPGGGG